MSYDEHWKTCTSCHIQKPRDDEHFAPYSGRSVDGLRPACRDCMRKADTIRKRERRAAIKRGDTGKIMFKDHAHLVMKKPR